MATDCWNCCGGAAPGGTLEFGDVEAMIIEMDGRKHQAAVGLTDAELVPGNTIQIVGFVVDGPALLAQRVYGLRDGLGLVLRPARHVDECERVASGRQFDRIDFRWHGGARRGRIGAIFDSGLSGEIDRETLPADSRIRARLAPSRWRTAARQRPSILRKLCASASSLAFVLYLDSPFCFAASSASRLTFTRRPSGWRNVIDCWNCCGGAAPGGTLASVM